MSSGSKVDLSNVRELLKIYTEIKTSLSTLELRDKANNTSYKVAPFFLACLLCLLLGLFIFTQ